PAPVFLLVPALAKPPANMKKDRFQLVFHHRAQRNCRQSVASGVEVHPPKPQSWRRLHVRHDNERASLRNQHHWQEWFALVRACEDSDSNAPATRAQT